MYKKILLFLLAWLMNKVRKPEFKESIKELMEDFEHSTTLTFEAVTRFLMAYITACDDGRDEMGNLIPDYVPYWKKDRAFYKVFNHYKAWLITECLFEDFNDDIETCLVNALTLMRKTL